MPPTPPLPVTLAQLLPIAATPAYLPTAAGTPVPPGSKQADVNLSLSVSLLGHHLSGVVEVQRLAGWTDRSGGAHPPGEWLQIQSFGWVIPPQMVLNNAHLIMQLGAEGPDGGLSDPPVDNWRVRFDTAPSLAAIPLITVTFS